MVNEIKGNAHGLVNNLVNKQGNAPTGAQANKERSAGTNQADNSDVRLTNTADLLKGLKAEIDKQPAVDNSRVAAIKQSVFDGTYNLNVEKTADKMLQFENMLGDKLSDK